MTIEHHLFLDTLRRTQFMPSERLKAYSDGLLEAMLRHARENVPFYRDRLEAAFPRGAFDREGFQNVPLLTRRDAAAADRALYASPAGGLLGSYSNTSTSGSTGDPFHVRFSALAGIASDCMFERCFEVHSIDRRASMARLRLRGRGGTSPYPLGSHRPSWNLACPDALFYDLETDVDVSLQAEWLLRRRPRYVIGYPSNLEALADHLDPRLSFGAVFTFGECVTPPTRGRIEAAFGGPLIDAYSCNEFGRMANQCPDGGLHVCAEAVLIELLDDEGREVPPGVPGRVVVTSFYNHVQPLVRYVMGDYAIWAAEPCGCGSTLPRLERIIGRARGMFHFPDGTQTWPFLPMDAFLEVTAARRFQVIQTARDHVEIRRVAAGDAEPDPAAVERFIQRHFHPSLRVTLVTVPALEQLPSGKMEIFASRVTAGIAQGASA
jgi:phenylacetate-CoA ligase